VCGLIIRAERAGDVRRAVEWHGNARTFLLTLTVSHGFGDSLARSRCGLSRAWRLFVQGAPWLRACERYGFVGFIRALEVTHGPNGFHPHLHVLLFLRELTADETRDFAAWVSERWCAMVDRVLGSAFAPSPEHGANLRPSTHAEYIAKLGLELAAPVGKAGRGVNRSPLEIALDFTQSGDDRDRAIWQRYCKDMKGARMLTWSRGLRRAVDLQAEKTDEEIVAGVDHEAAIVAAISGEDWDAVRNRRGVKVALLIAAETGGPSAVFAALDLYLGKTTPVDDGSRPLRFSGKG
jgi:hypothetical protein